MPPTARLVEAVRQFTGVRRSAPLSFTKHEELGWCRLARVSADDVHVVHALVEGLTSHQCDWRPTFDLHHDGTLEYVDERLRMMRMHQVYASRRAVNAIIESSLAGSPARSFDISDRTVASGASVSPPYDAEVAGGAACSMRFLQPVGVIPESQWLASIDH